MGVLGSPVRVGGTVGWREVHRACSVRHLPSKGQLGSKWVVGPGLWLHDPSLPCPALPSMASTCWALQRCSRQAALELAVLPAGLGAAGQAARVLNVLEKVNGCLAAVTHDGCGGSGGLCGRCCQLAPAPQACWGSLCCGETARCRLAPRQLPPATAPRRGKVFTQQFPKIWDSGCLWHLGCNG